MQENRGGTRGSADLMTLVDRRIARRVARILLKVGGVTVNPENPFVFQSGIVSPIYCDCRKILSFPQDRKQIERLMAKAATRYIGLDNIDIVAGTATAGIPFATLLASRLSLPMVYVRLATKEHGTHQRVEGVIHRAQKVLVVDDLISTAASSLSAVEAIQQAGGVVSACLAIITYEMAAATKALNQYQIRLLALCDATTLIGVLAKSAVIDSTEEIAVREWARRVKENT